MMRKTLLNLSLAMAAVVLLIALNVSQRRTAAAELAVNEGILAAVAEVTSDLETLY